MLLVISLALYHPWKTHISMQLLICILGEIAAAYTAGYLSAHHAILTAYYRGYVVSKCPTPGAMLAVGLDSKAAQIAISDTAVASDNVSVACINSPQNVTLSGCLDGINLIASRLSACGVFNRHLNTDGRAYHSKEIRMVGQEYENLLRPVLQNGSKSESMSRGTSLPEMFSSQSGGLVGATKVLGEDYWRANLESPVLFSEAFREMIKFERFHLVEVGPHAALKMPLEQNMTHMIPNQCLMPYSSALYRGQNPAVTALSVIGDLFLHGHDVNFEAVYLSLEQLPQIIGKRKATEDLQPYPWQHDKLLWNESRSSQEYRGRKFGRHDVLGSRLTCESGITAMWRNIIRLADIQWLQHHRVRNVIVFPASAYVAMCVEAVSEITGLDRSRALTFDLRSVRILRPLTISEDNEGLEVFTELKSVTNSHLKGSGNRWQFTVASFSNGYSVQHATGTVGVTAQCASDKPTLSDGSNWSVSKNDQSWYSKMAEEGLNFGPLFQSLKSITFDRSRKITSSRATIELEVHGMGSESAYFVRPIAMDSLFQVAIISNAAGDVHNLRAQVPAQIGSMQLSLPEKGQRPSQCTVLAVSRRAGLNVDLCDSEAFTDTGQVLIRFSDVRMFPVEGKKPSINGQERHPILRVHWKPDIASLSSGDSKCLSKYVHDYVSTQSPTGTCCVDYHYIAAVLDLVAHKYPRSTVLEIGGYEHATSTFLEILNMGTHLRRAHSYFKSRISPDGTLCGSEIPSSSEKKDEFKMLDSEGQSYDVVILPTVRLPCIFFLFNHR